uniref:hypothetical protein n=1 Tax=Streptomyces hawaiiensis TaxID=67305 RepID=UPI0031E2D12D
MTEVVGVGAVGVGRPARRDWTAGHFGWTDVFAAYGQAPMSDSTLRFRERQEIEAELAVRGHVVKDIRDAPDRPGREFVFLARRPESVR